MKVPDSVAFFRFLAFIFWHFAGKSMQQMKENATLYSAPKPQIINPTDASPDAKLFSVPVKQQQTSGYENGRHQCLQLSATFEIIIFVLQFLDFRQIVWDLHCGVRGNILRPLGWFRRSFHGDLADIFDFLAKGALLLIPRVGSPLCILVRDQVRTEMTCRGCQETVCPFQYDH